jgi:hypothetical protein
LQTGIILEDENQKFYWQIKKFCSMFDFEGDPDTLTGMDYSNSVEDSKHFFKNRNVCGKTEWYIKQRAAVYNEELELVDGRFLERSYIPVSGRYL